LSHTAQHRWHVEGALALPGFAAAEYTCPRHNAALHLFVQRIAKVSASHRSHLTFTVHWIADTDRLGRLYELLFKVVSYSSDQDEPFCRETNLTRVAESSPDTRRHRLRDISIFQHDESIRAAQLQYGLLDYRASFGGDRGASAHASRNRCALDTSVIDDTNDVFSLKDL
jgi:hypothetical protein